MASVVSAWQALETFDDSQNELWVRALEVSGVVTTAGAVAWLVLTIRGVATDVTMTWRTNKVTALITTTVAVILGIRLNAFARGRFEGEPGVERWLFFSLAWGLGCYLIAGIARRIARSLGRPGQ